MDKAAYFVQAIKEHKLTYGVFTYKHNKKKQTITFETGGMVAEKTIFDFINQTVTSRHKKIPMSDALPFEVVLGKKDTKVSIQFKDRRVCILESLQSVDNVKNVMNHLQETLLSTTDAVEPLPVVEEQEDEQIPIQLHKDEEDLPFLTAPLLSFNKEVIIRAKDRLKDKEFIQYFLKKESGDQSRRIFGRYIPMAIGAMGILFLIGWLLGFLWIYLAYPFYLLGIIAVLFFVFRIIIPSLKGADTLYYGTDTKYQQRIGIVIPLVDLYFLDSIPKQSAFFNHLTKNQLLTGDFDIKFILSYSPLTDNLVIENEYNQLLSWINETETPSYQHLIDKINAHNFDGKIQLVISSLTGYMPDSTVLVFYRSEIHPNQDNISIYHLEQLTPNRVVLGYSGDGLLFVPYYKEFWQDLSK